MLNLKDFNYNKQTQTLSITRTKLLSLLEKDSFLQLEQRFTIISHHTQKAVSFNFSHAQLQNSPHITTDLNSSNISKAIYHSPYYGKGINYSHLTLEVIH